MRYGYRRTRGASRTVPAALLAAVLVLQGLPVAALAEEHVPAEDGAVAVEAVAAEDEGVVEEADSEEDSEAVDEAAAPDESESADDATPEGADALDESEPAAGAQAEAAPELAADDETTPDVELAAAEAGVSDEPALTAQAIDASTYYSRMNAFISDARWANGTYWPQIGPKLSTYPSAGCFAYACDFTAYVYGINNYQEGQAFWSASEIRRGDVIRISGHTFVVLDRSGNDLYTAEGAFSDKVRVANPGYKVTASGGLTDTWGTAKTFETGYHFDITDDSTPPTISDARIGELREEGFTVLANVTDNVGVTSVRCAVWTEKGGQDDLKWYDMVATDNAYSFWSRISFANHNNERGKYIAHVYAYDAAGNQKSAAAEATIDSTPPTISSVQVTNLSPSGYTVSCTATDDSGILRVQFPTWTKKNDQDDIASEWWTNPKVSGTKDGTKYTFDVKISDHNNESGPYVTHIYAYDSVGNIQIHTVPEVDLTPYVNDTELPVITDFTLVSRTDEEIVFDVQATDNVGVSAIGYRVYTGIDGEGELSCLSTGRRTSVEDGHLTFTIKLPSSWPALMGDLHAVLAYAEDASGNTSFVQPSGECLRDNPNPTIYFDYEASPHVTLRVGETITREELFGDWSGTGFQVPTYYQPLEGHRVLSFDGTISGNTYKPSGDVYTASEVGTGTYMVTSLTSMATYGAVVTVVPDVTDLSGATVELPFTLTPCTGKPITPEPTVTLDGKQLVEGTDYEVSYANNVSVGTATVTVTGVGSYEGAATATFMIARAGNGWVDLAGGAKGYGKNGRLVTGWMDLDGAKYWFDDQGRMATGWTDLVVDGKEMHYYFRPSGNLARGAWADIDGRKYYFRPSGNMATGWATIANDDGESRVYYFDESGQMVTGWRDVVNDYGVTNHYYFRPSGSMATGWAQIDGEYFYFRPSGNMATGFTDVTDDAYKRYFDQDGRMLTGWQRINGNTYYFRASGAMQTGEATIDGMVFVFSDKGVLVG